MGQFRFPCSLHAMQQLFQRAGGRAGRRLFQEIVGEEQEEEGGEKGRREGQEGLFHRDSALRNTLLSRSLSRPVHMLD